jgi:hypothetical protein
VIESLSFPKISFALSLNELSLEMREKRLSIMRNPLTMAPLRNKSLAPHKTTLLCELFELNALSTYETLVQQCKLLFDFFQAHSNGDSDWKFLYNNISLFFHISRQHVCKLITTWEAMQQTSNWRINRRPKILNQDQMNQIIKYVNECDESFFPLTQITLLHWINTTFSKELTISWLQFFISNEKQLFIIDFELIEEVQSEVTEQQLIENTK